MSLKFIIALVVFALLSIYLAFLNPHEVEVYLTQNRSIHLPVVTLLLGFVLVGVGISVLFIWTARIRNLFGRVKTSWKEKSDERKRQQQETLFDQGTNAQAAGNLDKAAACFEKILNAHPNHIGALYHLGNLHRKNNRLDQAIDLHARAAAQAPDNIQVLFSLAEDYDASGQHRQKIEILKKAQRLNPGSMVPLFKLRDAYVQTGDWAQACAAQKQVLPLLRDKALKQKEQLRYSQLIYAKGMDHIKNGNPESAITEFRRALRENSRCLPAYIALGDLYRDSGHLKNALKTWKAGFQHTQSPVCLLRMQNRGDPGGDRKDLIKLYKGALEEAQNSDKALLSLLLGNLYLETGHPDEAIETLESVPAAHSMMHDILLANAYQEKHNPDQSQEVSQAVFSKAREAVIQFVCRNCGTGVKEWSAQCPNCQAWDPFHCTSA